MRIHDYLNAFNAPSLIYRFNEKQITPYKTNLPDNNSNSAYNALAIPLQLSPKVLVIRRFYSAYKIRKNHIFQKRFSLVSQTSVLAEKNGLRQYQGCAVTDTLYVCVLTDAYASERYSMTLGLRRGTASHLIDAHTDSKQKKPLTRPSRAAREAFR